MYCILGAPTSRFRGGGNHLAPALVTGSTLTVIVRKIRSIITTFGTEFPRLYF